MLSFSTFARRGALASTRRLRLSLPRTVLQKPKTDLKEPIPVQTRKWIGRGVLLSSVSLAGYVGFIGYQEIESLSEHQILFRISRDPQVRVDAIFPRIVVAAGDFLKASFPEAFERVGGEKKMEDSHLIWQVHVIDNPVPNAFVSYEGAPRQIFVTTGMLNLADTPDELALIMAHEMAHVLCNHSSYNAVEGFLAVVGAVWLFKTPSYLTTAALVLSSELYDLIVIKRRSRQHEVEADILVLKLTAIAGFDTKAAPEIFRKLAQYSSSIENTVFSTHPPSLARYHYLKELAERENREKYGTGLQAGLVSRLFNALWWSTINKNQSWGDRIKA